MTRYIRIPLGVLALLPALALAQQTPQAAQPAAPAAPVEPVAPAPTASVQPVPSARAGLPVVATGPQEMITSKWTTSLYGFVEFDSIGDSTQGFNDLAGNSLIARPGKYAADHGQLTFGVRNSRIGFKLGAPEFNGIKTSAVAEMDFLGNQPPNASEAQFWTNPAFRIRHMYLKMEDAYVDVLAGQYWQLFGWQSYFHPNSVEIQGLPGQIYSRSPQLRLAHTFKTEPISVEVAVAASRPPQRNSLTPDGQGGVRVMVNDWKGFHTTGATSSLLDSAAIGLSGVVRRFDVPGFETPTQDVSTTGWGFSADILLPVIPATQASHVNALTLNGSWVRGAGTADLYTGLNNGAVFPQPLNPASTYSPGIDNGLVGFDRNLNLTPIEWQSWLVGIQYYLPIPSLWVAANYSHMASFNAGLFNQVSPTLYQLPKGTPNYTLASSDFADGMLFWDVTPAVRLGAEYAWFHQQYTDGVNAVDRRFQLSAYYLF